MITSLDLPEDLVPAIDRLVGERRMAKILPYQLTEKERHEMHRIANEKGGAFANEYAKSLRPPKQKASRSAVIIELMREALAAREQATNAKPEAPKLPVRKK